MGNSVTKVKFLEERNCAPNHIESQEISDFLDSLKSNELWEEAPIDPEHSDLGAFTCHCFNPWTTGCEKICLCFSCRGLTEWSSLLIPFFYQTQFSDPAFHMDNEKNQQEVGQILTWMRTKKHHASRVLQSLLEHPLAARCARVLLEKFMEEENAKTLIRAIKIRLNQEIEFLKRIMREFEILAGILQEWEPNSIGRAQRVQFHHHLNRIERIKEQLVDIFCTVFLNDIPQRLHGILYHHNQEADYEWAPFQMPAIDSISQPQELIDIILKFFYLFGHTEMTGTTQMQEN